MSDAQLKSEMEAVIKKLTYIKSKSLLCPIIKIVSMRHKDISQKQIYKVAN